VRERREGLAPDGLSRRWSLNRGALRGERWQFHRRGAEALEDVVLAEVVVPVVVSGALVLDAELEPPADHARDGRVVELDVELVGKPVARADDVLADGLADGHPVVGGVADDDPLVEVQVNDADDALDGRQVWHVGALQADLLVAEVVEELGAAARLVEQRSDRRNRGRSLEGRGCGRARRRQDREVEVRPGVALHVAQFRVFEVPEGRLGNVGNLIEKGLHVGEIEAEHVGKSEGKKSNLKTAKFVSKIFRTIGFLT